RDPESYRYMSFGPWQLADMASAVTVINPGLASELADHALQLAACHPDEEWRLYSLLQVAAHLPSSASDLVLPLIEAAVEFSRQDPYSLGSARIDDVLGEVMKRFAPERAAELPARLRSDRATEPV